MGKGDLRLLSGADRAAAGDGGSDKEVRQAGDKGKSIFSFSRAAGDRSRSHLRLRWLALAVLLAFLFSTIVATPAVALGGLMNAVRPARDADQGYEFVDLVQRFRINRQPGRGGSQEQPSQAGTPEQVLSETTEGPGASQEDLLREFEEALARIEAERAEAARLEWLASHSYDKATSYYKDPPPQPDPSDPGSDSTKQPDQTSEPADPPYRDKSDQVNVTFKDDVTLDRAIVLMSEFGATITATTGAHSYLVQLPESLPAPRAIEAFLALPEVASAHPVYEPVPQPEPDNDPPPPPPTPAPDPDPAGPDPGNRQDVEPDPQVPHESVDPNAAEKPAPEDASRRADAGEDPPVRQEFPTATRVHPRPAAECSDGEKREGNAPAESPGDPTSGKVDPAQQSGSDHPNVSPDPAESISPTPAANPGPELGPGATPDPANSEPAADTNAVPQTGSTSPDPALPPGQPVPSSYSPTNNAVTGEAARGPPLSPDPTFQSPQVVKRGYISDYFNPVGPDPEEVTTLYALILPDPVKTLEAESVRCPDPAAFSPTVPFDDKGEIVVAFNADVETALSCAINSALGTRVVSFDPDTNTYCVRAPPGCSSTDLEKVYMRLPEVRFAVAAGAKTAHVADPAALKVSYEPVQWARLYVKYNAAATVDGIAGINARFGAVMEDMVVAGLYKVRIPVKYTDRVAAGAYARLFETVPDVSYAVYNSYYTPPANCANGVDPRGIVTDSVTGLPLEGALVEARQFIGYWSVAGSARTCAEGTYEFLVPAGDYTLVCSRTGYLTEERAVTVFDGEVLIADFALVPDPVPPQAPTGLTVTQDAYGAVLEWSAPPDADLSFYRVYVSSLSGGPYDLVGETAAPVFTDTHVRAGSSYCYVVRAVDDARNESAFSNEVAIDARDLAGPAIMEQMTMPAVAFGSRTLLFCFLVDETGVTSATFEYYDEATSSWQVVGVDTQPQFLRMPISQNGRYFDGAYWVEARWDNPALSPGATVQVRVSAGDGTNTSTISLWDFTFDDQVLAPPAPDRPLVVAEPGRNLVSIEHLAGEYAYRLYRSESGGGQYEFLGSLFGDTVYSDIEVSPGATYYYVATRVSLSSMSESPFSAEASALALAQDGPCAVTQVRSMYGGDTLGGMAPVMVSSIGPVSSVRLEVSLDGLAWTLVAVDSQPRFYSSMGGFTSMFVVDISEYDASLLWLRASALDAGGTAGTLAASFNVDRAPPDTPIELIALPAPGGATLYWRMPQGEWYGSYRIWRSEAEGRGWRLVADGYNPSDYTNPSFTDSALEPGVTCFYAVSAVSGNGNESALSMTASVEADLDTDLPQVDLVLPAAGRMQMVMVAVSDNSGIDSVSFAYFDGVSWIEVFTVQSPARDRYYETYTIFGYWDTTTLPEGEYQVRAVATDVWGNGNSRELTVSVDHTAPGAPLDLVLTPAVGSISLSWSASPSTDVVSYAVYRAVDPAGPYQFLSQDGSLSIQDAAASANMVYFYRVLAIDQAGNASPALEGQASPLEDFSDPSISSIGLSESQDTRGLVTILYEVCDDVRVSLARFEYSTDGGTTWNLIGHAIAPQGMPYYWQANQGLDGEITVRVTARDPWNNEGSDEATMQFGPLETLEITYLLPEDSEVLHGDAFFYAGAIDDTAVTSIAFYYYDDVSGWVLIADVAPTFNMGVGWEADTPWDSTVFASGQVLIRVIAADDRGTTRELTRQYLIDNLAPGVPAGLTVAGPQGKVLLTWQQVPAGDFDHYNVYRAVEGGGPFELVASLPGTEYLDAPPADVLYLYAVSSVDALGNESSTSTAVEAIVPLAPSGLTAAGFPQVIRLAWDASASPGVSSYRVFRSESAGGPYALVAAGVTSLTFVDDGCAPGVVYFYVIHSVCAGDFESAYSDEASATAIEGQGALSDLTLDPVNNSTLTGVVQLTFTAVDQAAWLNVTFRYSPDGATWTFIDQADCEWDEQSGTFSRVVDWDTSAVASGFYLVSATATDSGGQTGTVYNIYRVSSPAMPPGPPEPPDEVLAYAQPGMARKIIIGCLPSVSSWTASYNLYRRLPGDAFELIGQLILIEQHYCYLDTDVEAGLTYEYMVRAVGPDGSEGPDSPVASATALADEGVPVLGELSPTSVNKLLGALEMSVIATDSGSVHEFYWEYFDPSTGAWVPIGTFGVTNPYASDPVLGPWYALQIEAQGHFPCAATWDLAGVAPGGYEVRVSAADRDGHVGVGTYAVSVLGADPEDVTPPGLVTIYQPNQYNPAGIRSYIYTRAEDETGIVMFRYYWSSDGTTWTATGSTQARRSDGYWGGSIYPWDTSALPEGTVWFRAVAVDAGYNETSSEIQIVIDHTTPGTPGNLTAAPVEGGVLLSWDPVGDGDLACYRVYRGETETGHFSQETVYTTSYEDVEVEPGHVYFYRVVAVDSAGNESARAEAFAIPLFDVAPPEVTGVSPEDGSVVGSFVSLEALGLDNGRVDTFDFDYYDSASAQWVHISTSTAWYRSYDGVWQGSCGWYTDSVGSGLLTVRVTATDAFGNQATREWTLVVDREPPSAPEDLSASAGMLEAVLTWTPVEVTDLASYRVYRSLAAGGPYSQVGTSTGPSWRDTTIAEEGGYYYVVTAVDAVGNESAFSNESYTVVLRDEPPVFLECSLQPDSRLCSVVWVDVRATDDAGVSGFTLRYSTDGSTWTDAAWVGAYYDGTNWIGYLYWDTRTLPDGVYRVRVLATDSRGQQSYIERSNVEVDNTAPPAPSTIEIAPFERAIILTWSAVIAGDLSRYNVYRSVGGGSYWLCRQLGPGETTLTDQGLDPGTDYSYYVTASDNLGNESAPSGEASACALADATPPVVVNVNPGEGSLLASPVTISASALDNTTVAFITISYSADGVDFTEIGRIQGGGGNLVWDSGALPSGHYFLRATANDACGLESDAFIVGCVLDNDAPAAPALSARAGEVVLTLYWQACAEGDLAGYRLYRSLDPALGYVLVKETTSTFFADRDVITGTTYFYRLASFDRAGNESAPCEAVGATPLADTTPPFVQAVTPGNGARVNGVISITVRASDNVLVDLFDFYRFNGAGFELFASGVQAVEVAAGVWQASAALDTTQLAEGDVILRVEATDYGANVSFLDFTYTVDRAPPAPPTGITVLDPASGGRLVISWDASTESDLAGYRLYRSSDPDGPFTLVTAILASNAFEDSSVENDALYYYRASAVDVAGNESESSEPAGGTPTARCDVAVIGISFAPANPVAGRNCAVYVVLSNAGPAPVSFIVGVYVGEPLTGTLVGQFDVSLSAGSSCALPVAWTPDAGGTTVVSAAVIACDVTDTDPADDQATTTAIVTLAPVAEAGPDVQVDLGLPVDFDASGSSDPDGQIVSWSWEFGDGSSAETARARHTFGAPGLFTATLRVTDDAGAQSTDTLVVAVRENRPDLVVESLTWVPATPDEGQVVTVTVRIANRGSGATTRGFLVGFHLNGTYLGNARVDALLAVGQTVDVTYLWTARAGGYLLEAVADDLLHNIDESDETNNALAGLLSTTQVFFPDLEPADLSWSPAKSGWSSEEMVSFAADVLNNGDAPASAFYVSFFLDGELLGRAYVGALAAGGSLRVSVWAAPRSGSHTLEVRADAEGRVVESDESDNTASIALPAFTLDFPDLEVVSLNWLPGETAVSWGASLELVAGIRNSSGVDISHAFNVTFFVDGTPTGRERVFGLAAGATIQARAYWPATGGAHLVKVVVDEQDEVLESSAADNSMELEIPALVIVYPDLYLSDVTFEPAEVHYGNVVRFTVVLGNAGVVGSGEVYVGLLVDGQLVATARVDSLQGYSSRELALTWKALAPTSMGHTLSVVVDPGGTVPEQDETNNAFDLGTMVILDNLVIALEPYSDYYVNGETADVASRVTYASAPDFTLTPDYGVVCYMTVMHRNGGVWVDRAQMSFDPTTGLYHYLFSPGNTGYAEFTFTLDAETPEYQVSVPGEFNYIDDIVATVTTDKLVYERCSIVRVTGRFTFADGSPVANRMVNLMFERGIMPVSGKNTGTDEEGRFSYDYIPPAGIAGHFILVAQVFFGAMPFGASTEFEVLGLLLTPSALILSGVKTQSIVYELVLSNVGDTTLADLAFRVDDLDPSDDVTATLDTTGVPASLQPGASHRIALLVQSASEYSPSVANFTLRVTASGGEVEASIIEVRLADPVPLPVADPTMLKAALRPGMSLIREVRVTNMGHATLHSLSLEASRLVPWIVPVSGLSGDLPPGAVASIQFLIAPPAGTVLGTYQAVVTLAGTERSIDFGITCEVTNADRGGLFFVVQNDVGQPLPGAHVTLTGRKPMTVVRDGGVVSSYFTVLNATTDSQGHVLISDVPVDTYDFTVTCAHHESAAGIVEVLPLSDPEIIPVTLTCCPVSWVWTVEPVTIADTYHITLEIEYLAEFAKPALLGTPPWILVAHDVASDIFDHLVVMNPSDVAIREISLSVVGFNGLVLATNYGGTIEAGGALTVPYKIMAGTYPDLDPLLNYVLVKGTYLTYDAATSAWVENEVELRIQIGHPSERLIYFHADDGWDQIELPEFDNFPGLPRVENPLTALVKIEISQQATLEREAFRATLTLTNPTALALEGLFLTVRVRDGSGADVTEMFYPVPPELTGLSSIDGSGALASGQSATVAWTLIPKPGLGGDTCEGKVYHVYAAISYRQGGKLTSTTTDDAEITIKPEPELFLYYYLPRTVEAGKPFKLGILVENRGSGTARNLTIESGLPRIVENLAGLAIEFDMLDSSFGSATAQGFTVEFGDVAPGETRVGYWILRTSLPGTFLSFTSTLTHDAYKGTELHPLICGISSEIIAAEDMAPLEDDPGAFYTLVDRDSDGFPDYLISLASGVKVEFRMADSLQVTHPCTDTEPYLGFSVPESPGPFLAILSDPAPERPNITGITTGARTLSARNYFRRDGKLFVLDRNGGTYEATFGSGLIFKDLYHTVGDNPRSYPYLPDPGSLVFFRAVVENRGAVSEAGLLSVYLAGSLIGTLAVPELLPYEIWESGDASVFYAFPTQGYSVENSFEVRLPGETRTLAVTLNVPPSGAIELPVDLTVLVPATFRAIDLIDPDGEVVTCYWDFGDSGYGAFHYQASGVEVTYTYLNSGTYTVKMIVKDDNQCATTMVTRTVTVAETRPDLVVTLIGTDPATLTEPWTPAPVSFTVRVSNQGTGATTGSFLVGLYLDGVYLGSVSCPDILEPGQSATLQAFTITLEDLNHVFTARADDNDLVSEADENNNQRSLMLTTDYPDLTIAELTCTLPSPLPGEGQDGDTYLISYAHLITATARITNLSNTCGLTFCVVFYSDGQAFASREVEGLAQGEEKAVSVDFLPTSGIHLLSARVDADLNRVVEENEENNEAGVTLPELTILFPDIEILTVSASPASGPVPIGSPLYLQALIRNAGAGNALLGFNLSFYLDGSFAGSRRVETLASGETALITLSCPATGGNHTLRVAADEEGFLPETVEDNNEGTTSFGALSIRMSDLVITSFTLTPDAVSAGDTVLARITVANLGEAATLSGFEVLISLDGVTVAIAHIGSLQAGSTTTVQCPFTASVDDGTHTVSATVDASNLIEERNESNNQATASLITTGTWTPPAPDTLALSLEASQASYSYDETIQVSGDALLGSEGLSDLLVAVSFSSPSASFTSYVRTDATGHWTFSIPVLTLLEAGLSGPLSDLTITATCSQAGQTANAQIPISITVPDPASPILILIPSELLLGLKPGDFRCVELRIANVGNASLTLTAIKGMALLPWMSVAVPAKMDLFPGESITVNLYLAPPSEMTLPHAFSGNLKVEGLYGPEGEEQTVTKLLPFTVELSNPDLAYLDFRVFGIGHEPLSGATVTLLDLLSYAAWQTGSNSEGSALFADIPMGEYLYFVSCSGYAHALGKVTSGNLQAGITIEVTLTPEELNLPASICPVFTMTASADHCYEREPVLLTLRVSSGITELEDVAAHLRVIDSSGADVTSSFEILCLSQQTGILPQDGYRTLQFLAVPYSNTAGDYTLKAIFSYSVEGLVKSTGLTTTLQVRGPPALAITYFIPSEVEIGKNYRAGFELANYGSTVSSLRMDYFYLPLQLSNWSIPASYLLYDGSITLEEGGLSAGLGTLESQGSTRGYLHLASSFYSDISGARAGVSYTSSIGIRLSIDSAVAGTHFIFRDQVFMPTAPEEDASLISPEPGVLPSYIYCWTGGDQVPVTNLVGTVDQPPTLDTLALHLTIQEKDGYVLVSFEDSWSLLVLERATRDDGAVINDLNVWRSDDRFFLLDDPEEGYYLEFGYVQRVDEAADGYAVGLPDVGVLSDGTIVVTWQELRCDRRWYQPPVDLFLAATAYGPFGFVFAPSILANLLLQASTEARSLDTYNVMCGIVQSMEVNNFDREIYQLDAEYSYRTVSSSPAIATYGDQFAITYTLFDTKDGKDYICLTIGDRNGPSEHHRIEAPRTHSAPRDFAICSDAPRYWIVFVEDEIDSDPGGVYACYYDPNMGLSSPLRISGSSVASAPDIANNDLDTLAVWSESGYLRAAILCASDVDGHSEINVQAIPISIEGDRPSLVSCSGETHFVLAWRLQIDGAYRIRATTIDGSVVGNQNDIDESLSKAIVRIAGHEANLHVKEGPEPNQVKYNDWFYTDNPDWPEFDPHANPPGQPWGEGLAWCAVFVSWAFSHPALASHGLVKLFCTGDNNAGKGEGYVPDIAEYLNDQVAKHVPGYQVINASAAQAGDIVIFGANSHIGIVEKIDHVDGVLKLFSIEGNAGPLTDGVYRIQHELTDPMTIFRLPYPDIERLRHSYSAPDLCPYLNGRTLITWTIEGSLEVGVLDPSITYLESLYPLELKMDDDEDIVIGSPHTPSLASQLSGVSTPVYCAFQATMTSEGRSQQGIFLIIGKRSEVSSVSPQELSCGQDVVIAGTGFGDQQNGAGVYLNGIMVSEYTYWSDSMISFEVPSWACGVCRVEVFNPFASNSMTINVVPAISSIEPDCLIPGSEITITGTGFGDAQGTSSVTFGTTTATDYLSWSNSEIRVIVPIAVSHQVGVSVTTEGGTSLPFIVTILRQTILTLYQPDPVQYSDETLIQARLTDCNGVALSGLPITFILQDSQVTAITDPEGLAVWMPQNNLPEGAYEVICFFAGDGTYAPSLQTTTLTSITEDLAVIYTGDEIIRYNSPITLSALLLEDDSCNGDLSLISQVTFRLLDSDGILVQSIDAPVIQIEPGKATASTSTSSLPVGLYTVQILIGDNPYYSQTQLLSCVLVVYSPDAGTVQGAGISLAAGLRTAAFKVSYRNNNSTSPTGNFVLLDISGSGNPRLVVATSFTWMVIPSDENVAYIEGNCFFNGQGGYIFSLEVQDNDTRKLNSCDRIIMTVFNPLGVIVYELDLRFALGEIRIKR